VIEYVATAKPHIIEKKVFLQGGTGDTNLIPGGKTKS
jgi:hypothetical protein